MGKKKKSVSTPKRANPSHHIKRVVPSEPQRYIQIGGAPPARKSMPAIELEDHLSRKQYREISCYQEGQRRKKTFDTEYGLGVTLFKPKQTLVNKTDKRKYIAYRNDIINQEKSQALARKLNYFCIVDGTPQQYHFIALHNLIAIKNLLKQHSQYLDLSTLINMLKRLAKVTENKKSRYVLETITILLLERLWHCIPPAKNAVDMTSVQLNGILKILPNLHAQHKDFKPLYTKLMQYTVLFLQLEEQKNKSHVNIKINFLNALAKWNAISDLHLSFPKSILLSYFKTFEENLYNIANLKYFSQYKLFEALVYMRLHHAWPVDELLADLEAGLAKNTDRASQISTMQKQTYKHVASLLAVPHRAQLQEEALVGPYRLDLSIRSEKTEKTEKTNINIETDGFHHSRLGTLRIEDQLRDWVLSHHYGFRIFRFSNVPLYSPKEVSPLKTPLAAISHLFQAKHREAIVTSAQQEKTDKIASSK